MAATRNIRQGVKVPSEEIHRMIGEQIRKNTPLGAKHWKESTEPVTAAEQSLNNLYDLARRRKVGGKTFFGHGTWKAYLKAKHGVK